MSSPSEIIVDARGRIFAPLHPPFRIVSLVPSITELLFDLGLGMGEIVGRTKFCVHPHDRVRSVPAVGGTKTVDVKKVRNLLPDLVIANIDENQREVVDEIESGDNPIPVVVTHPRNPLDALGMVRDFGILFGTGARADTLIGRIKESIDAITGAREGRALYLIWRKPYITVSPDTYIHGILSLVGYSNAIDERWLLSREFASTGARRYPMLTARDIAELAPDIVLFSSEPFPFKQQHIDEFLLMYNKSGSRPPRCSLVDGELFSWYGTRIINLPGIQLG